MMKFLFPKSKKKEEKPPEFIPPCPQNYKLRDVLGKKIIDISCKGCPAPSTLKNHYCRAGLMKILAHEKADGIFLNKNFRKIYSKTQTAILSEAAKAAETLPKFCARCTSVLGDPRKDLLGFFYMLSARDCPLCGKKISEARKILSGLKIISASKKFDSKEKAYSSFFKSILVPSIVTSEIDFEEPKGEAEEKYKVGDVSVSIFKIPNRVDMLYFLKYPELSLGMAEAKAVEAVIKKLGDMNKEVDFEPDSMRHELKVLISEFLSEESAKFPQMEKEKLEKIILRHTVGYGVIEPLLADEKITDVYVDSSSALVHIVHGKFGECITNLHISPDGIEKLATRLRATSGRPLDASSPVLHTEIEEFGVRVAGICEPSTYKGIGFAFRRRKTSPWTLAEFVDAGMLDPMAAGFLSFVIDGKTSILVVGPRASGKTSLLTAMLLEIPQSTRIILIEDTPEIPVHAMQNLGYKIEHLKTEAFAKGFELSAEDALRTSLRLGESTLVLGEVRGKEAKALFEAMRVGAAGNVVLGTIHGSSAYDTWDRVVNDLGVPSSSFKAVDLIVTAGSIRFGDDLTRHRRLLSITEVGKDWTGEPVGAFKEILKYSRKGNKWKLNNLKKSETLKRIAEVKGISVSEAIRNIKTRAKIKQALVKLSKKNPDFLSAEWAAASNVAYTKIFSETKGSKKAFKKWLAWAREKSKGFFRASKSEISTAKDKLKHGRK